MRIQNWRLTMDKVYTVTYEPPTDKKPAQLRAKHQGKEYVLPFQMEMWGKLDVAIRNCAKRGISSLLDKPVSGWRISSIVNNTLTLEVLDN